LSSHFVIYYFSLDFFSFLCYNSCGFVFEKIYE